jgi:hypothetical protein
MQISLKVLNESYPALVRLTQQEFPKEQHKLSYKLARILRSARTELETGTEFLNQLMAKFDIYPGQPDTSPEIAREYNAQAESFMKETLCPIWGEQILYSELAGIVNISPFDLALLDWLIIEGEQ